MFLLSKFKKKFLFNNNEYNTIFYLIVTFLLLTTIYDYLYFSVEKMDSILTMIYYNIVTASTVGYGDFSPQTAMGKILTAIYIPIAISLFAALLSVIGSMIYSKIHRRDHGVASISTDVDYLILGGYKEKVEEVAFSLMDEGKKVVLVNQFYETFPLEYKQRGLLWIKGDGVSGKALSMIDHEKVQNYMVLSSQPTQASSDMLAIYSVEKLLTYAKEKPITVEVVNRLSIFPEEKSIRYISVVKGILVAKELLRREFLLPLEGILENRNPTNQYNVINSSTQSWGLLKQEFYKRKLSPIGYWNREHPWVFFPDDAELVEEGAKIKLIALSSNEHIPKELSQQNILLIGNNQERMEQLKREYLLDERYRENSFRTIESLGTEVVNVAFNELHTHVVIFADLENAHSDTSNYFYWRYFREKFPEAKIVVELLNNQSRLELERKYEDEQNEFVSMAQIGLMVQELQDEGIIQLVESLSEEEIESISDEIDRII